MTATDLPYPSSLNEGISTKARTSYKISINDRPILDCTLERRQRGGQGLGKRHRIRGFYIDADNRVYAEYILTHNNKVNGTGSFYHYAIVGRLHVLEKEAV